MSTQDIKNTSLFAVDQASCMNSSEEQEARTIPTVSPLTDAVPSGWLQMRNKDVFRYVSRPVGQKWSEFELLTMGKAGVSIRDVESGKGKFPSSFDTYQEVRPGDFVFCLFDMDETPRTVGLSGIGGMITGAYDVFYADSDYERFLYYWYLAVDDLKAWKPYYRSLRKTITRDMFMSMRVLVPPRSEAVRISKYLDRESQRIEELKDSIREQIDALEAYKRSLILETVTKGLHPNPELVASKIDWIGDIPAHWSLRRLGTLFRVRNERVSASSFEPLSVTKNGILPQLEHVAKTDYTDNRKLVRAGDFVINSRSDRRGSCGISPQDGSVSLINTVLASRDLSEVSPYFGWLLHSEAFSDEFYRWGHGIVADLWTTNWDDMRRIVVPLPPAEEQDEINDFLKSRTENLDSTIRAKHRQLELLDSYKQSLIYESVTGKKEVPVR